MLRTIAALALILAASPAAAESSRPRGCPHAFCGCEASLYLFHRIIPHLNLAANWFRFPQTSPAPGMAAVRRHHVMVLMYSVGEGWMVHDGNSGHGKTREHVRSLAGYVVVDPSRAQYATASSSTYPQSP